MELPQEAGLADDERYLHGAKVLIVDDHPQNVELLEAYLESLPVERRAARNGEDALREVEAWRPDVVLLDVMMPRISGFEVCEKLKADPATRDIPVIMVTALNEVGDVERGREAGADDFLSKPFAKEDLLTRVKSLLRVRMMKREAAAGEAGVDLDEETGIE